MFKRGELVRVEGDDIPIPWVVSEDQVDEDVKIYHPLTREALNLNGSFVNPYN